MKLIVDQDPMGSVKVFGHDYEMYVSWTEQMYVMKEDEVLALMVPVSLEVYIDLLREYMAD